MSTSQAIAVPIAPLAAILASFACWVGGECRAGEPVIDMMPGVVKPARSVELSPSVDGVLEVLSVAEGDRVEAGQVLATVDRALAEASLRQAEFEAGRTAAVDLASTRVRLAEKYLARIEQAHAKQAASDLELDEARGRLSESHAALAEANEQLAAARKQLAAADAQYAAHEVDSPFAGEVVRIDARVGEMVQRAKPVLTVIDLTELRADLYVPTELLPRLKVGERYTLSAEAPISHDLEATLIYREPRIDAATDTFRCRFLIDNQTLGLPSGFAVRLCEPAGSSTAPEPIALAR